MTKFNKERDLRSKRSGASGAWFLAAIVLVASLGYIHRFTRTDYEPNLMLDLQDGEAIEDYESEDNLKLPREQRGLLRETAKEEAFPSQKTKQLQAEVEIAKAEAEKARIDLERLKLEVERTKIEAAAQPAARVKEPQPATATATSITVKEKLVGLAPAAVTPNVNTAVQVDRKVYFMPYGQVDDKDAFSASWIQKTEDFMDMNLQRIAFCEDAATQASLNRGGTQKRGVKLRMTLDWLDFSLEHLSKWYKTLAIYTQKKVFDTAMARFGKYFSDSATYPLEKEQSFVDTIAVIAYQPYTDNKQPDQAFSLTVKSLGATMESIRRAGMGRVVVVGDDADDTLTSETFRALKKVVEPNTVVEDDAIITTVGHMQVAYAQFNEAHGQTKHASKNVPEKNVPKATLMGLKEAFDIAQQKTKDQRTPRETQYVKTWLGDKEDWSYVYLTEPDSILQTRPGTLKQLKTEVDKGMVLVPHRLQPIPHESDARGTLKDWLYLPEVEFPVTDLDVIGENDSCCDAHLGPYHKPGNAPMSERCGNFWYMCDFDRKKTKEERTHFRIKKYSLIRLVQGTGIVNLAGAEHGRPCIPKKNEVCLPPPDLKLQ